MTDYNIRDAKDNDLLSLSKLLNEMYKELGISFSIDFVKARLKSRFFLTKVIIINEQIVGFSTIKIVKNEYSTDSNDSMGFLYELYVIPSYRRQKLGKVLLNEMEKALLSMDIFYYELYVRTDNNVGRNFWISNELTPKYEVLCKKL